MKQQRKSISIRRMIKKILALPKRLWPLTPWTIVFAIIALVFCAEVSALVIQYTHNNGSISPSDTTTSTGQTDTTHPLNVTPTTTQSTPTQSTSPTTKSSGTATTSNLPDADGCIPNTSGYQDCHAASVQVKFMLQCEADMKAANDSYYATYNPQWNSYNADVNAKRQELNSLVGTAPGYTQGWADGIWLTYEHDRAQQFNSAVSPAYNTYVATYNNIVARGCNVTKTWPDPSLHF